ncbi:HD domain-containing protein [Methanofollis fontis]|uniref:Phosphohydrolase n=1 Tax=Methanofollis fontis TaxID=2052832 RepID=A0A483D010_9EURY|nr:HD domain-containing protein [Methanofollis fontis]TAJ45849.1 phosphohydrolase [Methanofollis fontis]
MDEIRAHVQAALGEAGAHGLDHTLRVTSLCEEIGRAEEADMEILITAALFHDIARPLEKETGIPHEEEGARIAADYLRSRGWDERRVEAVAAAVRTHRYRSDRRPGGLEAQILSDADKLDAMGAVGIARTFLRAGEHGGGIPDGTEHIHEKLLNLRERIRTPAAREIAEQRHAFLEEFVGRLEGEMGADQPSAPLRK